MVLRPVTDCDARAYIDDLPWIRADVSYMLVDSAWGVQEGYCVMALKNVEILKEKNK